MKFHMLKHFVVDTESGAVVAAFMDSFTALMWELEFEAKTGRELEVKEFSLI
jgi:hypothetical protein